jgi:autotransporter strand-loop-strand O-heptosyltransferase
MSMLKINDKEFDMTSPTSLGFRNQYIRSFGDTPPPEVNIKWFHIDGFQLELSSSSDEAFRVQIFNREDQLLYEANLNNGMFCKLYPKYFNGIKYRIYSGDSLVKEETITFEGKRVFISFDSSSVGDTICWVPYCEEFRKKHNCEVVVSTFMNYMFEKTYPNLTFVSPGSVVENIFAMFRLGWFWDEQKEPVNPVTIPLQKAASNILGLEHREIQTKIHFEPKDRPYDQKYICIATNSTAGCKLWNHPTGWRDLISYLLEKGYLIVNISKEGDKIEGVENLKDDSMLNTMNVIHHSEFVIGLSSGLSWLSWGLGKHVVMISNFTEKDHEFVSNCTRITNPDVCNGCWNNPMFKFDKGDWYWCPEHKGTERQFECHKSITPEMVINQIQHLLG